MRYCILQFSNNVSNYSSAQRRKVKRYTIMLVFFFITLTHKQVNFLYFFRVVAIGGRSVTRVGFLEVDLCGIRVSKNSNPKSYMC